MAAFADRVWRGVFRVGFPLTRCWWRIRRPRHQGALVAIHVGDELLLVRSSYRKAWNFPGGGVKRGEQPHAAARRELLEEIGLTGLALTAAGSARGTWDSRRDHVHFFETHLNHLPPLRLDNREIVEARLMSPGRCGTIAVTGPVAVYLRDLRSENAQVASRW